MASLGKKLLIINAAALGYELLKAHRALKWSELEFKPAQSVLPAVTCSVQASFRTATPPSRHGMIANGRYFRDLHKVMFWEQSADLVAGKRIWSDFRAAGGKVAMLFWQQSLGEDADVVLSPAPIHKHHGGMIQDCYAKPAGLYQTLCEQVGRPFNLMHYWGPLASPKVGDWIADATAAVLAGGLAGAEPDLCLVYLPTLDYELQRHEHAHRANRRAVSRAMAQILVMYSKARQAGYEVLIFGDYAIADLASGDAAVYPNRRLLDEGLLAVREVRQASRLTRQARRLSYPDFHASRAFAVVDHEIAHVYVKDPADVPTARKVLGELPGIGQALTREEAAGVGLDHPNAGELVLVAKEGRWLAYPWWMDPKQAPDYAAHIDIHNKPGYDPCELFFGWPPMSVSSNTARIRGSHGRVGAGREIAYASTIPLPPIESLLDLSRAVCDYLT